MPVARLCPFANGTSITRTKLKSCAALPSIYAEPGTYSETMIRKTTTEVINSRIENVRNVA